MAERLAPNRAARDLPMTRRHAIIDIAKTLWPLPAIAGLAAYIRHGLRWGR